MSATGYSTYWLQERYAIDAESRSKSITNLFMENLRPTKTLQLLDLGAGLGSNVKYFCPKFSCNQNWYCVEIDPHLIKSGIEHLSLYFENLGFEVVANNQLITAIKEVVINISYIESSVFDISSTQFIAFDGILGNALLDVFTAQQLSTLFAQLMLSGAPKLFSINYEEMEWGDDDPQNEFFTTKYHQHMQRKQAAGNALGPDTIEYITTNITFQSGQVILSESDWNLDHNHSILLNQLIGFYKSSIPEMINNEVDLLKFKNWTQNKITLIEENNLKAIVKHADLLCLSK